MYKSFNDLCVMAARHGWTPAYLDDRGWVWRRPRTAGGWFVIRIVRF
jgi:hypothetical protein